MVPRPRIDLITRCVSEGQVLAGFSLANAAGFESAQLQYLRVGV